MDTATHLAVGVGLAGLAHVDPLVAADPHLSFAVFIGTIAGSQAPDCDTLLRLRSNALYIRNHRGISHSLPAIIVWTVIVTAATALITGTDHFGRLALWVLAAVSIHVWQDLFNTYGTQLWLPFRDKWVAWNIIHIFDPFIFIAHLVAILLWIVTPTSPQWIFPILYLVLIVYYSWRSIAHALLERKVRRVDPQRAQDDQYHVFPTYRIGAWNIVKRLGDHSFSIGEWNRSGLHWVEHVRSERHPAIDASKRLEDVRALRYLTTFAYAECTEHEWGYEVRWTDVRYRHRKQYPFVAIALLDHQLNLLGSYVGWLSEAKLQKKLRLKPQP